MFENIVTIFNYYESSTGSFWYPHVLSGAHLETDRGQIIKKYGQESTDNAMLHISFAEKDGQKIITDATGKELRWMPPKQWKKQVNDELPETITFGPNDFFLRGAWEGDFIIDDKDYTDRRYEGLYAYMNAEADFVFRITTVGGPYNVIPHFEILGA